jgi:hypothetical protein
MKLLKNLYSWGLAQIPCQTKENYLGNPGYGTRNVASSRPAKSYVFPESGHAPRIPARTAFGDEPRIINHR